MKKLVEELDYQQTAIGELTLRRRSVPQLGDVDVYEVKLGDAYLMSSLFHAVEEAVSNLGLGELDGTDWDVVVGGLGLGYTAVAALAWAKVRSLTVVEFLRPVIDWHLKGLVPLGKALTSDPRCRFLQADFFARALSGQGFAAGQRFHAVLLDIDHSPRNLLDPANAAFYSVDGLNRLNAHLHPGGVFALWSDDPPDDEFLQMLRQSFASARAEVVTFPNPLLERESASTVYVARKA